MVKDISALVTPHQIHAFETSQAVREAITLLGQLSRAHTIQITQDKGVSTNKKF